MKRPRGVARLSVLGAIVGALALPITMPITMPAGAATTPAAPPSPAAPRPFGQLTCTPEYGIRFCPGGQQGSTDRRVPSFDGVPLDADVALPATGKGPFPLIVLLHGLGESKKEYEVDSDDGGIDDVTLADRGYAVLMYTARGFGDSCGTAASRAGTPACAKGWIQLADQRYEVRDTQYLAGRLVDEGLAKPDDRGRRRLVRRRPGARAGDAQEPHPATERPVRAVHEPRPARPDGGRRGLRDVAVGRPRHRARPERPAVDDREHAGPDRSRAGRRREAELEHTPLRRHRVVLPLAARRRSAVGPDDVVPRDLRRRAVHRVGGPGADDPADVQVGDRHPDAPGRPGADGHPERLDGLALPGVRGDALRQPGDRVRRSDAAALDVRRRRPRLGPGQGGRHRPDEPARAGVPRLGHARPPAAGHRDRRHRSDVPEDIAVRPADHRPQPDRPPARIGPADRSG